MLMTTPKPCSVASEGQVGESYNIGGWNERRNIDVVQAICGIVDELAPDPAIGPRETPHHLCRRSAGTRPSLCHRCAKDRAGTRVAAKGDLRDPGCVKRWPGISRTAPGGSGCAPASTAANGSGLRSRSAMLTVKDMEISAVKVLTPKRFDDGRSFFCRDLQQQRFAEAGVAGRVRPGQPLPVGASGHSPGFAFSESRRSPRISWCA